MVRIEVERLADMNIPRTAHSVFSANGEVTVVGGHTTNFVPTATAEYYKDGRWHLMETAFPHDNGICVVLSSGKVLLGGGSEKPLGIGQTFPVEEYDPATHTFRAFSCFETKRTLASALEIDSGRVVVTGNWYAGDSIEVFDGDRHFHFAKEVSVARATPFILRIAPDDVLILGGSGTRGEVLHSDVVDRLKGEPFHVPLLRQWHPLFFFAPFCTNTGFIGDEDKGDYAWLLPVQDWSEGDSTEWAADPDHQLAFVLVRDTTFTLLPTVCPVPKEGLGGLINYYSPVIADRKAHRGYVHGIDKDNRHYIVSVEYDKRPAPITLYYTDPLPEAGWPQILLTDEGDLLITGGINYNRLAGGTLDNDNYSPLATVFLLHLGQPGTVRSNSSWLWGVLATLLLVAVFFYLAFFVSRNNVAAISSPKPASPAPEPPADSDDLMQRILVLMEQEHVYLDSELKLNDLVVRLGTNRNAVSAAINQGTGCSFSQFISGYRVRHAQDLMLRQPDMKMAEVWMMSGFSTESSFFRAFKVVAGTTPNEWKSQQ